MMNSEKMQSNHDAFMILAKKICLSHMNQQGNTWKIYDKNSKFYCSMEPEVFDEITTYGGSTPYIIVYPILLQVYTDENEIFDKIILVPLFCVKKYDHITEYKFFDLIGRSYNNVNDFIKNNHLPPGKIAYPDDFHFEYDNENHEVVIEWANIDTEKKLDDMEKKRHNNWINFIGTAGITAASVFALTCSGALPAFATLLGASILYGDDNKCDPLDDPVLKEAENSIKLFENCQVLLPKHYRTSECTQMPNMEIARKMIIMAGQSIDFHENEIKNSENLFSTINKELGSDDEKWQIFCGNGMCLYDVRPKTQHYMNLYIKEFEFVIFVPAIETPNKFDEEIYNQILHKYKINKYTNLDRNQNITKMMENIILRLCTNNIKAKDIVHCMQDVFGGNWNCFLFTGYHTYQFTFKAYITFEFNSITYCLFY